MTKQKYGPEVWKELPADWLEGLNIKTQVIDVIKNDDVEPICYHLKVFRESSFKKTEHPGLCRKCLVNKFRDGH